MKRLTLAALAGLLLVLGATPLKAEETFWDISTGPVPPMVTPSPYPGLWIEPFISVCGSNGNRIHGCGASHRPFPGPTQPPRRSPQMPGYRPMPVAKPAMPVAKQPPHH